MNQLLSYLLQMTVVSGLLYGYYHLALRNQRFHAYNRFFLVSAVLFSLMIPLLNIPLYFRSAPDIPNWNFLRDPLHLPASPDPGRIATASTGSIPVVKFLLFGVYSFFALVLAVRLFISLVHIRKLIARYGFEKIGPIRFVNTKEPGTPFSFFNWMFWDQRVDPLSTQGKQVFRHEMYHITQKHSLDILFMELVTLLAWFNPLFHFYKKELKAIHEFLADEYAMKEAGSATYAELLLVRALRTHNQIVNPFFHNQIKRRLHMILKDQTPAKSYLRKILVLPLVFLSLLLFAFSFKTIDHSAKLSGTRTDKAILNDSAMFADTSRPTKAPERLLVVIDGKTRHIITNNMKDSMNNILSPDQIQSINILKGEAAVNKYGKEWAEGVIEISTKPKTSFTTIPDKEQVITVNGKPIRERKDTLKNGDYTIISDSIVVVTGHKIAKTEAEEEENKLFTKVEIEAAFPGGSPALKKYLETHLDRNIGKHNGAPDGNYSVVIQFVVALDGSISDIRALTSFGYGMEAEAIRVLKMGPKWLPAVQNGKNVVAYKKQVFNFY